MPAYVYTCPACNAERVDMRRIEERHDGPTCDSCYVDVAGDRQHVQMVLRITPVAGTVKNPAVAKGWLR